MTMSDSYHKKVDIFDHWNVSTMLWYILQISVQDIWLLIFRVW